MNIFKVIASGNKSFFEEQMSAVLAWFLHPQMEHGLGYEFLSRILNSLAKHYKTIGEIELKNKLRGDNTQGFGIELEDGVTSNIGNAHIDILISVNEWRIAIENKIYERSASDITQLNREYQGMISKYPMHKCALIFLVPIGDESGETLPAAAEREYNAFMPSTIRENEFVQVMTWQKNNMGYPSICEILESILQDDSIGEIEPINEYTRHTMKALTAFIKSGFSGYDYERLNEQSGLSRPKISVSELMKMRTGYIGVKGGIVGLLRLSPDELMKKVFQFSDSDMRHRNQWLPVETLQEIYNWRVHDRLPNIQWGEPTTLTLPYDLLYQIVAKSCPPKSIFIGIKGGEKALKAMVPEMICQKSWQITSSDRAPNNQWLLGIAYRQILTRKGLWQTGYPDDRPGVAVSKNLLNRIFEKYGEQYNFAVYDTHPCSELYDCISVVANEKIHLIDFNLNGRLHLHRDVNNQEIKQEPIEFIDAFPEQIERIYHDVCKHVFLERSQLL